MNERAQTADFSGTHPGILGRASATGEYLRGPEPRPSGLGASSLPTLARLVHPPVSVDCVRFARFGGRTG
jgi:hypothetical protein